MLSRGAGLPRGARMCVYAPGTWQCMWHVFPIMYRHEALPAWALGAEGGLLAALCKPSHTAVHALVGARWCSLAHAHWHSLALRRSLAQQLRL